MRQILVQVVLLGAPFTFRGGRLDTGVAAERNEGIGALEAVCYLATALLHRRAGMSEGAAPPAPPPDGYEAFARRIASSGILTDPWIDGEPRFREEPLVVTGAEQRALYRAAEDVAAVYDELCILVVERPALLDDFFGLTPWQKAMWLSSAPLWHGIARADLFLTDQGIAIAELNSDTPTGEAEAVILSALAVETRPDAVDPNRELGDRFCEVVETLASRFVDAPSAHAVGFVYPTEFTEDLSVVRLYRRWLEERDWEVILGSPYNLGWDARGPLLFGRPFSVLLRHYKTDWWGERGSVWDDEKIADADALEGPLRMALTASLERKAAVVNPFGSVLPQNKRAMAFMWEHLGDFSPRAQEIIRQHVPESARLETLSTGAPRGGARGVGDQERLRGRGRGGAPRALHPRPGVAVGAGARARGAVDRAAVLPRARGARGGDRESRRVPRRRGSGGALCAGAGGGDR